MHRMNILHAAIHGLQYRAVIILAVSAVLFCVGCMSDDASVTSSEQKIEWISAPSDPLEFAGPTSGLDIIQRFSKERGVPIEPADADAKNHLKQLVNFSATERLSVWAALDRICDSLGMMVSTREQGEIVLSVASDKEYQMRSCGDTYLAVGNRASKDSPAKPNSNTLSLELLHEEHELSFFNIKNIAIRRTETDATIPCKVKLYQGNIGVSTSEADVSYEGSPDDAVTIVVSGDVTQRSKFRRIDFPLSGGTSIVGCEVLFYYSQEYRERNRGLFAVVALPEAPCHDRQDGAALSKKSGEQWPKYGFIGFDVSSPIEEKFISRVYANNMNRPGFLSGFLTAPGLDSYSAERGALVVADARVRQWKQSIPCKLPTDSQTDSD